MENLTLIIPAKNEKESLPHVLDEIKKLNLNCKIKVCLAEDDKDTIEAIKNYQVELFYQNKKGYGAAIYEGIESDKNDYFCIFNADGSFDPNELVLMLNKLENDKVDFLFASRYLEHGGSDDDTFVTLLGNKIFSLIGKIFFKLPISDILYTFVIGKTSNFKKLNIKETDFRFCVELPIKAVIERYKINDIPSYERPRIGGIKKVNAFKDGWLILTCMIKLFFKK